MEYHGLADLIMQDRFGLWHVYVPVIIGLVLFFVCTAYVGLLKKLTLRHCPDQFDIFGGVIPFTRLLEPHLYQNPMGRCFPASHASAGFALVSLYFVFSRNRIWSFCGLALGFSVGIVFSYVQVIRGAHFVSHNIAAALLCWIISLLLWRIVFEAKCNK